MNSKEKENIQPIRDFKRNCNYPHERQIKVSFPRGIFPEKRTRLAKLVALRDLGNMAA